MSLKALEVTIYTTFSLLFVVIVLVIALDIKGNAVSGRTIATGLLLENNIQRSITTPIFHK